MMVLWDWGMPAGIIQFFAKQYLRLQPSNRFCPFPASAFSLWRERLRLCLRDCDSRLVAWLPSPDTWVWNMTFGIWKTYQDVRHIILKLFLLMPTKPILYIYILICKCASVHPVYQQSKRFCSNCKGYGGRNQHQQEPRASPSSCSRLQATGKRPLSVSPRPWRIRLCAWSSSNQHQALIKKHTFAVCIYCILA